MKRPLVCTQLVKVREVFIRNPFRRHPHFSPRKIKVQYIRRLSTQPTPPDIAGLTNGASIEGRRCARRHHTTTDYASNDLSNSHIQKTPKLDLHRLLSTALHTLRTHTSLPQNSVKRRHSKAGVAR